MASKRFLATSFQKLSSSEMKETEPSSSNTVEKTVPPNQQDGGNENDEDPSRVHPTDTNGETRKEFSLILADSALMRV